MKIIRIKTCDDCIGKASKGTWESPKNIPYCTVMKRVLPHTVESGVANYTGEIPDWCPLEDEELK